MVHSSHRAALRSRSLSESDTARNHLVRQSDYRCKAAFVSTQFAISFSLFETVVKVTNFGGMNAKKAVERDWASLPPGVLNLIAKNLSEIFDFVRFRAVCTAWSSSTPITDLPPQFPWILEDREDGNDSNLRFYNIPSNKLYTIDSPKFLVSDVFGLIEGYMPIMQNYQLVLLNPLSNHDIHLPSYDFDSSQEWSFTHRKNRMGKSVVSCVVYDEDVKMIFCTVGQENWRILKINPDIGNHEHYYFNDMLFFEESDSGVTKAIDITTGALAYAVPPVKNHDSLGSVNLVETSGDILRFCQHYDQSGVFSRNDLFDVHRLDVSENGSPCWVEVKTIGNYAFFTDMKGGFVLKANSLARIKANSIYFLEEIFLHSSRGSIYQVRRIDIETGATELLPFPFKHPSGWFVPILHHL